MSTTSVYSIRIDTRIRAIIEEINDPVWQEEIRTLIEQAAKRKHKAQILARAREAHGSLKVGSPAAESIRADRDAR
ncbi:MAG: hypothetical protein PHN79_01940 [Methanoregula sp.]|nr:hypothetical protein [Methanoregula sp.]